MRISPLVVNPKVRREICIIPGKTNYNLSVPAVHNQVKISRRCNLLGPQFVGGFRVHRRAGAHRFRVVNVRPFERFVPIGNFGNIQSDNQDNCRAMYVAVTSRFRLRTSRRRSATEQKTERIYFKAEHPIEPTAQTTQDAVTFMQLRSPCKRNANDYLNCCSIPARVGDR